LKIISGQQFCVQTIREIVLWHGHRDENRLLAFPLPLFTRK